MPISISSLQNSRIKDVIKLAKHNERDQRQVTVVEGERECSRALAAGIIPVETYICPPLLSDEGEQLARRLYQLDRRLPADLPRIGQRLGAARQADPSVEPARG